MLFPVRAAARRIGTMWWPAARGATPRKGIACRKKPDSACFGPLVLFRCIPVARLCGCWVAPTSAGGSTCFADRSCSRLRREVASGGIQFYRVNYSSSKDGKRSSRSLFPPSVAERWPSGLRRRFAKPLYGQKLYPGFKSLPLRQTSQSQALPTRYPSLNRGRSSLGLAV